MIQAQHQKHTHISQVQTVIKIKTSLVNVWAKELWQGQQGRDESGQLITFTKDPEVRTPRSACAKFIASIGDCWKLFVTHSKHVED